MQKSKIKITNQNTKRTDSINLNMSKIIILFLS